MKKGLVLACSAITLAIAMSSVAEARDGLYLAARGGLNWSNLNSKNDSVSQEADVDFDKVGMYSAAIGYKYGYIRGELEYIFREENTENIYVSGALNSVSSLETESLMANLYLDFMPNYWISPYISGGIGYTKITLDNYQPLLGSVVMEENKFSWQLGAGLSLRLNRCLNVDFGYRYYTLGKIREGEVNAHEWYGGVRFTF